MKHPAALALLALLAGGPAAAESLDWHAAPAENLEAIDVETIGRARETLDMAAYALTDWAVMDALAAAGSRGVAVRIVLDGSQFAPKNAAAHILALARADNVAIRIRPSHSGDIMHMKAYLVDARLLRTGSANFSPSGLKRQDNDLLTTTAPAAVAAFERTFEAIWDRADAGPTP